jgi:DNA uptake protein ComE-like DNA-binding protein
MALVAVLVVMGGAILVATSLLFVAQAEVAGSARTADRVQSHALAWSGVQAAMTRLNEQREVILEGSSPRLDEELIIYELDDRVGVARLLPVGPGGERLVPEAGKLDLNSVDADMLSATELIDEAQARAVIDHRDSKQGRPFQSVGELLWVEGLSVEAVYGPTDELAVENDVTGSFEPAPLAAESDAPAELRGLADVTTVYGFEPALQQNGRLRINLNVPWSEELGGRVADRFGSGAAQTLQRIMESGTTFESEAKIFEVLRFFQVPMEDWPEIVDTFTTEEGEFHFGRLDINTAPYEALAALPGLEPEQAAEIVQVRHELEPQERSTIVWPAIEGIIEPEAYDQLAGRITTRCWTWRLRLAAGEVGADDPEAPPADLVVYDVVIDLSAPRPRVAYLRDVTWLATTARIAAGMGPQDEEGPQGDGGEDLPEPVETAAAADADGEDGEPAAADDPLADAGDEPARDMPAFEQPIGEEPVRAGGAVDSPPPAPPSGAQAPTRTRIGRWTAG